MQVGGPLGSLFPESQLDIPICYHTFAEAGAILGHGGIVVYDQETDMVELARHFMAFAATGSCGKCTPCPSDPCGAGSCWNGFRPARVRRKTSTSCLIWVTR